MDCCPEPVALATARDNLTMSIYSSWIDRFLDRSGFVLRKGTCKPILADDEIMGSGAHFITEVRSLIQQHNIPLERIYNLDETAVFLTFQEHHRERARSSGHPDQLLRFLQAEGDRRVLRERSWCEDAAVPHGEEEATTKRSSCAPRKRSTGAQHGLLVDERGRVHRLHPSAIS